MKKNDDGDGDNNDTNGVGQIDGNGQTGRTTTKRAGQKRTDKDGYAAE